jgi:hypothetical protein
MFTERGTTRRILRLGAMLALVLAGAVALAGVAQADPANEKTFTVDVVCEGQPLTITVMMAAHPPSSNGAAGHIVGSTPVGVLMGLSVRNLITGEDTVILERPIAERQDLATCSYTFEPLLPPFLVFTASILLTPRS